MSPTKCSRCYGQWVPVDEKAAPEKFDMLAFAAQAAGIRS